MVMSNSALFPQFPTTYSSEDEVRIAELEKLQAQQQDLYNKEFAPETWQKSSFLEKSWRNVLTEVYAPPRWFRDITPWQEMGSNPPQAESYIKETQDQIIEIRRKKSVSELATAARDTLTALALSGRLNGEEAQLYEIIPSLDPNNTSKVDATDAERQWFVNLNKTLATSSQEQIASIYQGFPQPKTMEELVSEIGMISKNITPEQLFTTAGFLAWGSDLMKVFQAAYPPQEVIREKGLGTEASLTPETPLETVTSLVEGVKKFVSSKLDNSLWNLGIKPTGNLLTDIKTFGKAIQALRDQAGYEYKYTYPNGASVILTKRSDGFYVKAGDQDFKVANVSDKGYPVPMTQEEQFTEDVAPRDRLDPRNYIPTRIGIEISDAAVKELWATDGSAKSIEVWMNKHLPSGDWESAYGEGYVAPPGINVPAGSGLTDRKMLGEFLANAWSGDAKPQNLLRGAFSLAQAIVTSGAQNLSLRPEDKKALQDIIPGLQAGVADTLNIFGGMAGWANIKPLSEYLKSQSKEMYPDVVDDLGAFEWHQIFNPRLYTIRISRAIPFSLALLPIVVFGWEGGAAVGGATALRLGLGTFGTAVIKTAFGGILGGSASRIIESAMEAGDAWNTSKLMNGSDDEADSIASDVFKKNMALTGGDILQVAAAFAPVPFKSTLSAFTSGIFRVARVGGRMTIVGLSNGGEEVLQEAIQRSARGENPWTWDSDMQQAFVLGTSMGIGMGAGGDILSGVINKTEDSIPVKDKPAYDAKVKAEGQKAALDELAATPQGQEIIEKAVAASSEEAMDKLIKDPTKRVFAKQRELVESQLASVAEEEATFTKSLDVQLKRLENPNLTQGEKLSAQEAVTNIQSLLKEVAVKKASLVKEQVRIAGLENLNPSVGIEIVNKGTWEAMNYIQLLEVCQRANIAKSAAKLSWEELTEIQQEKLVASKSAPTLTFDKSVPASRAARIAGTLNSVNLDFMGVMSLKITIDPKHLQDIESQGKALGLLGANDTVEAYVDSKTGTIYFKSEKVMTEHILLHEVGHAMFDSKIGDPAFFSKYAKAVGDKNLDIHSRETREGFAESFADYANDPASISSKVRDFFEKNFPRARVKIINVEKFSAEWDSLTEAQRVQKAIEAGIAKTASRSNFLDLTDVQQQRLMGNYATVLKVKAEAKKVRKAVVEPLTTSDIHERVIADAMKIVTVARGTYVETDIDSFVWDEAAATKEAKGITGELAITTPNPPHLDAYTAEEAEGMDSVIASIDETFFSPIMDNPLDVAATIGWKFDNMAFYTRAFPDIVGKFEGEFPVSQAFKDTEWPNPRMPNLNRQDTYRVTSFLEGGKLFGDLWRGVITVADRLSLGRSHINASLGARYYQVRKDTGYEALRPNMVNINGLKKFNQMSFDLIQEFGIEETSLSNDILLQQPNIAEILKDYTQAEQESLLNWAKGTRSLYNDLFINMNIIRAKIGKPLIPYRRNYIPHMFEANVWGKLQGKFFAESTRPDFIKDYGIKPDFITPNQTSNVHALARSGALKNYKKITDVDQLTLDYIKVATADMFYTPLIMNAKAHAKAMEDSSPIGAKWLVDWATESYAGSLRRLDKVAIETPGLAQAYQPLQWMRRRLISSVFPANWPWNIVVQQSSMAMIPLQVGMKDAVRGFVGYITSQRVRNMIRANMFSYITKQAQFGSVIYQDKGSTLNQVEAAQRSPLETVEHYLNFFTSKIEAMNTGVACYAGYLHGLEKGYAPGSRKLIEYASYIGAKTQSMYDRAHVPGILRSHLLTSVLPFQTFFFEAFNSVCEISNVKFLKAGAYESIASDTAEGKGLIKNRVSQVLGFMAVCYAFNIFGELVTDRKPWEPSSFVPFYGLLTMGTDPYNTWNHPLPQRFAEEFVRAFKQSVEYGGKNGLQSADLEPLIKWFMRYTMPAGVQAERMMEGIRAVVQGGSVTDIEGKELYELDKNTPEYIKAVFMGLNYTESAKEYRARMTGSDPTFDFVFSEIDKNFEKLGASQKGEWYTLKDYGRDSMAAAKDAGIPDWVVFDESLAFPPLAKYRAYCESVLWKDYGSLSTPLRLDYRRDNPEVDASLVFWEMVAKPRSVEAQEVLLGLFNEYLEGNVQAHWKGLPQVPDYAKLLPE